MARAAQIHRLTGAWRGPEQRDCQRSKIKAAKTKTLPGLKEDLKCVLKDEHEKEK